MKCINPLTELQKVGGSCSRGKEAEMKSEGRHEMKNSGMILHLLLFSRRDSAFHGPPSDFTRDVLNFEML